MTLETLNALPTPEATDVLMRCCGSPAWADAMAAARPFLDQAALMDAAERLWWNLGPQDWREAFAHHPRIGDRAAFAQRSASRANWAASEQAGAADASDEVLLALAQGNRAYEEKFGYIFLVCATGRGAEEMLTMLERRLSNDLAAELRIAAMEQAKITRIRIGKLLGEEP